MKQRIKNYLLRSIVKVIIPDDIIRVKNNQVYLGSQVITEQEKKTLQAEAKALESMRLWSIMNESIKQLCYEKGWRDSTTLEQLNISKSMYSVLETQRSIVERILTMV
jgi:hypothetical protein